MARDSNSKLEVIESLLPTTQISKSFAQDETITDGLINNLKHLKYITFTLPVLSRYKYTSYRHNGLFSDEMVRCYKLMESTAIDLVYKIAIITRHTWKYGSNTQHFAKQFIFMLNSLFIDLPLTGSESIEPRTKTFLLETFDDLYFQRQIQLIVHDVFLGLDNIYLKYYIVDFLEVKYGYKIPVNFFVIGVCSLGLQLYRDKIQGMTIVQPTIEVENGLKTSMFKWFKINF